MAISLSKILQFFLRYKYQIDKKNLLKDIPLHPYIIINSLRSIKFSRHNKMINSFINDFNYARI